MYKYDAMYNSTMAQATVRRIGNSLGIVLPREVVLRKRLKPGDRVEVEVEKARTVMDMWGYLKGRKVSARRLSELADEGEDLG
jgi:antitoxin component of MazEF toxin-antitoxin module